jgi:hypothetical protein
LITAAFRYSASTISSQPVARGSQESREKINKTKRSMPVRNSELLFKGLFIAVNLKYQKKQYIL